MILAFYADDFTGSTDALDQLAAAGWRSRLFMGLPDAKTLADCGDLDAVGIAGITRSLNPAEMENELTQAFSALNKLSPQHVHYKVCSTFDSSPTLGSIGKAVEVGRQCFPHDWTPLLVGAPSLGRYCVFGNLFARMGIGGGGRIHRLDRHPSMSQHPSTPADESDIRLHLARQTDLQTGLVDVLDLEEPVEEILKKVMHLRHNSASIVLFDALNETHILRIGEVLKAAESTNRPLFSVGSSSIEKALVSVHLRSRPESKAMPEPKGPILVLSGSRSGVTEGQIRYARDHGFVEYPLDVASLLSSAPTTDRMVEIDSQQIRKHLVEGRHVILHTAAFEQTLPCEGDSASLLGTALGRIGEKLMQDCSVGRLILAGGDTSGHAARTLGIHSVERIAPLWPGAPLCLAQSNRPHIDGCEIVLKGGQVGDQGFFLRAAGIQPSPHT